MNTHLMATVAEVNNFLTTGNEPPRDLFESLLAELQVSNLFIAAIPEEDGISFEHLESDEGIMILPLYSSKDKYTGENELISNPFFYYAGIVRDLGFEGVAINPDNESLFIPGEVMSDFRYEGESDDSGLGSSELKRLSLKVKNSDLLDFIGDDNNFNRFDELIGKLRGVTLLNVVSSSHDLSDYIHDGIIDAADVGGFDFAVKTVGREKYGLLFTSLDKIRNTCDRNCGIFYYYQLSDLNRFIEYVLMHDMDGIIINPSMEEYFIPRNVLLDIYLNFRDITENENYISAMHYAFLIE